MKTPNLIIRSTSFTGATKTTVRRKSMGQTATRRVVVELPSWDPRLYFKKEPLPATDYMTEKLTKLEDAVSEPWKPLVQSLITIILPRLADVETNAGSSTFLQSLHITLGIPPIAFVVAGILAGLIALRKAMKLKASAVTNGLCIAYPIYKSLGAIERPEEDNERLYTYWSVYGLYSITDTFAHQIVRRFPNYWSLKLVIMFWIYARRGSSTVYMKIFKPLLVKLAEMQLEQQTGRIHSSQSKSQQEGSTTSNPSPNKRRASLFSGFKKNIEDQSHNQSTAINNPTTLSPSPSFWSPRNSMHVPDSTSRGSSITESAQMPMMEKSISFTDDAAKSPTSSPSRYSWTK